MIIENLKFRLPSHYNLKEISDISLWKNYLDSQETTERVRLERLISFSDPLPANHRGWCSVCNDWCDIVITDRHSKVNTSGEKQLAYSETCVCLICKSNSRMRAGIDFIDALYPTTSGNLIYLTEHKTKLFKILEAKGRPVVGSEYLVGVSLGSFDEEGTRCEDLTSSTFPRNSFSVIGSFDVLEHVPDYQAALLEIFRILEPNGIAVLTFPFNGLLPESRRRASLIDGKIINHRPPIYHGNPISNKGALVFNDLSWDVVNYSKKLFSEASLILYSSFLAFHFGVERTALILRKGKNGGSLDMS